MLSASLEATDSPHLARAAWPFPRTINALVAGLRRDLTPATISAGLTAFVFYVTAGVPLLLAVAERLGLDASQTSSWFFIVFFSTAVTSIGLSLTYRQPLPLNWSLPGLVYLAGLAGHFSYPELVGANLMAGVVIVCIGALGLGKRMLNVLPLPIALGMFAGSILSNLSDLVTATLGDTLIAGATIGGYLLGRLIGARAVPPVGLAAAAGAAAVIVAHRAAPVALAWTPPTLGMAEAQFSWSALVGISLPLVVLSVGLGNAQGLGFLIGQGYRVPVNLVTLVVGIQSVVNALFGGHQAIVGRSGVAILASAEAGPQGGRYWGCLISSGLLIPVAFAATPLAALLPAIPAAYVAALAGLAILPSFQEALARSFAGGLRLGATTAFVVAATPFAIGGIPSAFWALLAGVVVSLLAEPRELLARNKERKGS